VQTLVSGTQVGGAFALCALFPDGDRGVELAAALGIAYVIGCLAFLPLLRSRLGRFKLHSTLSVAGRTALAAAIPMLVLVLPRVFGWGFVDNKMGSVVILACVTPVAALVYVLVGSRIGIVELSILTRILGARGWRASHANS
jgi:hypothetical protein